MLRFVAALPGGRLETKSPRRSRCYNLPPYPEGDDGPFFDRDAIDIKRGYVKNFVLPISGYISNKENPKEALFYYGG